MSPFFLRRLFFHVGSVEQTRQGERVGVGGRGGGGGEREKKKVYRDSQSAKNDLDSELSEVGGGWWYVGAKVGHRAKWVSRIKNKATATI